MTIRNPIEWAADQVRLANSAVGSAVRTVYWTNEDPRSLRLSIRHIEVADLRRVLAKGFEDFRAYRTDVIFLSLIYPVVGLILARMALGHDRLPLVFPLVSGFALIGPIAAIGLYEMSRRREQGVEISWGAAFGVLHSPQFGAIATLGLALTAIFLLWLTAAEAIYKATLGPMPPASIVSFMHDVVTTPAGWTMIGLGIGVGFLFAVLVLAISVVSFPLLIDREVGLDTAVWTSIQVAAANPRAMAAWGLIVAAGLVLGSIPLFVGLVVVMPVLGHATWHLYRRAVAP